MRSGGTLGLLKPVLTDHPVVIDSPGPGGRRDRSAGQDATLRVAKVELLPQEEHKETGPVSPAGQATLE